MVPEGRVMDIESGQGPTAKKGRLKTTSVNHYWYTFTYKYNTNATGSASIYMVSIFSCMRLNGKRLPHGYLFRPETLLARTIITNTPIWTSI